MPVRQSLVPMVAQDRALFSFLFLLVLAVKAFRKHRGWECGGITEAVDLYSSQLEEENCWPEPKGGSTENEA